MTEWKEIARGVAAKRLPHLARDILAGECDHMPTVAMAIDASYLAYVAGIDAAAHEAHMEWWAGDRHRYASRLGEEQDERIRKLKVRTEAERGGQTLES